MKKKLILSTLLSMCLSIVGAQIIVDFEDAMVDGSSFAVAGTVFNMTGDLNIHQFNNFSCDGSPGQNKYIDSGYLNGGTAGVLGSIAPMNSGVTFRLSTSLSQCGWPGRNDGEFTSTGTIRFTGTKEDLSTIQEDFQLTSTNFTNLLPFTFSQSIWGGADLISLQLEIVGTLDATDYFALDNLVFEQIGSTTNFWSEDFETDGNGTRYALDNAFIDQPNEAGGSDDYFGRVQNTGSGLQYVGCTTAPIAITNPFTGQSGQFFIAGEDVDDEINEGGCGNANTSSAERNLSFLAANGHGINITGASDMIFRMLVANGADDNCGDASSRWDQGEGLKVFYSKDGGAEVEALCFAPNLECSEPMDVSNEPLHLDLNCDGDGENGFVNNVFTEYAFVIPAGGNSLELRVWINADQSDEEIAFDNLRLEAENVPVSFAALPSACQGEMLANLGGGAPSGGTYSGPGVTDNGNGMTFNFNATTAGTQTITYTVNGTSVTSTIEVIASDDASFSYSAASYCAGDFDPIPMVTGVGGGSFTSSPVGLSVNGANGAIDVSASTPGNYTVTYNTTGTCPNSSNVNVTINGLDDASFSYSAASFCVNDIDPVPTITGLAGGSFSITPAGLSINTANGAIDLSASSPGNYGVTYSTVGVCPNSTSINLTINIQDDASFSYAANSYNVDDTDPSPTITGLAGGTFSSMPGGLSIDGSTGVIDLSESSPNTYTITYTTSGTCPNSSSFELTVNDIMVPTPGNDCLDFNDINPLFGQPLNEAQVSGLWDNTNYTTSASDPSTGIDCFYNGDGLAHTIWYSFIGDGNTYGIRTVACVATNYITNGDTQFAVYSGDCGNLSPVACAEDEDGANGILNAYLEFPTDAGVTYYIMLDGYDTSVGEFCLEITNLAPNSVSDFAQSTFKVLPNPTAGMLELQGLTPDRIELVNTQGKVVLTKSQSTTSLDISHVPDGIYFLIIYEGDRIMTKRIIKK